MEFDNGQLQAFLDQIARDEAHQLERLDTVYALESRKIRNEARQQSRLFHHQAAKAARLRIASDHHRKLSRARSEFRRRRWQKLEELRICSGDAIERRLQQRWREPASQLAWCRFWLDVGKAFDGTDALLVSISSDVHDANLAVMEKFAVSVHPQSRVVVDEDLGQGILVGRGLVSVDGLLRTQLQSLLDLASRDLAQWLHWSDADAGEAE